MEQSLSWKTERIAGVSSALTKHSASHFPQLTGPYRGLEHHIFLFLCEYPLKKICLPSMLRVSSVVEHVPSMQKALNSVPE